jgi:hypothetical protein
MRRWRSLRFATRTRRSRTEAGRPSTPQGERGLLGHGNFAPRSMPTTRKPRPSNSNDGTRHSGGCSRAPPSAPLNHRPHDRASRSRRARGRLHEWAHRRRRRSRLANHRVPTKVRASTLYIHRRFRPVPRDLPANLELRPRLRVQHGLLAHGLLARTLPVVADAGGEGAGTSARRGCRRSSALVLVARPFRPTR